METDPNKRIDQLETRLDTMLTSIEKISKKHDKMIGHVAKNRLDLDKIENHVKQEVKSSLAKWSDVLDTTHSKWQMASDRRVDEVCSELRKKCSDIQIQTDEARRNGAAATRSMVERGDRLETFAMAQFARIDARIQRLDELVQQAIEMVNDAKSRQNKLDRALDKLDNRGPLVGMMSGGMVTPADVVCRANRTVSQARQRSEDASRELLLDEVADAQCRAVVQRGRSIGARVRAAQKIAARSVSRARSARPASP